MVASNCIQDVSFPDCESSHVGKLCLQMNCNSDCIHVLRSMVAVMTARAGMAELQSNRVAIAVDELFANIAAHAYNGKPGRVEFEACIGNSGEGCQQLNFNFRDYASAGWNGNIEEVTTAGTEIHDSLCPGGLGLRLIRSVADRCEHEVRADGNHWRLIFNISDRERVKGG